MNSEENFNMKKILVPTIVAVVTLIIAAVGATYAYFAANLTNSYSTRSITASTGSNSGTIVLASNASNLTLALSASDMAKKTNNTTYYATTSGKTTTETSPAIATVTVTGSNTYKCDYSMTITKEATNDMYTAFQSFANKSTGQIVLTVKPFDGTAKTLDFNTANLFNGTNNVISGSVSGLGSSSTDAKRTITAQLKILNSTSVDQSAMAGKDITLKFTMNSFSCVIE